MSSKTTMASPSLADALAALARPSRSGHFDELRGCAQPCPSHGAGLAAHWAEFFNRLSSSGLAELDRKTRELREQVQDNGITYNIYAEHDGPQRPWSVDLLPLIIDSKTWAKIESGVLQRARLLEKIMADVYGPRRLLRDALIPPALIQGHPGYLRPMHGAIESIGGRHLHIVAFDLARGPDDEWAVISQRTQAPSGLGYLLENRVLISRHFPQAFADMTIAALGPAYQALVGSLKQMSPAGQQAHVALLTPGPLNETYFEHAYLARHLGLTLVEGSDLTVRDQRLFLRTLRGLEPVDVLLKRLDDEYLDPLELRPDSTLGVPGLIQAIRAGNVLVANAPGSGPLESPALLGFLPAISQALLGEALKLPGMDTWWCGEDAAMRSALPNIRSAVLKPTYPPSRFYKNFGTLIGASLSDDEHDRWLQRINLAPDEYTVQAQVPLAQMPTWQPGDTSSPSINIFPRSYVLRVFALRDGHESWQILPGGLARIALAQEDIASMQRGGSSADVWVQSSGEKPNSPSQNSPITGAHSVGKRVITSRAAENLFWFGRYTERSENTVRLARLCLETLNGEKTPSPEFWGWIQTLVKDQGLIPAEVPAVQRRVFERSLIHYLNDHQGATSVGHNLAAMQRSASVVRERLATEQWNTITRCIDQFSQDCREATAQPEYSSVEALQALFNASTALAAITGSQIDRMTRDDGWQLLSIGRLVERLGFLTVCMRTALQSRILDRITQDEAGFAGLLVLFDSTITYRAQHQQHRGLDALLDLTVIDPENPRSISWVAQSLRNRLSRLESAVHMESQALCRHLPEPMAPALDTLLSRDPKGSLLALMDCLVQSETSAWEISDVITARLFSHIHLGGTSVGA